MINEINESKSATKAPKNHASSFLKGLVAPNPEYLKILAGTWRHASPQQTVPSQVSALPSHANPSGRRCGNAIP